MSLNTHRWTTQVGAFALVSAVAVAGFWKYHAAGAVADIHLRQMRLVDLRSERAKALATGGRLDVSRERVIALEHRLQVLKTDLAQPDDVAGILRGVERVAAQSNLTIRRFTPQTPKVRPLYTEFPFKLQAEGTSDRLSAFVDEVGRFHPVINLTDLTIKARAPAGGASVDIECLVTTFVLQENAPPVRERSGREQVSRSAEPAHTGDVADGRDPFVSLISGAAEGDPSGDRPMGLRGVLVAEIALKGIMKDPTGFLALVQGPDKRTFMVRSGQKLFDGAVKTVTADALVLSQHAEDPGSRGRQREVIRKLRPGEKGGE